jgi:LacI family transcriptional regulator/LacI family repressor for deo operon, udp, cdd, tsx, nupC, and nupG
MLKSRCTLKDVAKATGVSSGTVSRALRRDPLVNETTRLRILQAAEKLDYRINLAARGMRTGSSGSLGLACASGPWVLHHPLFAPVHAGYIAAAAEEGVHVVHYLPPNNGRLEFSEHQNWAREMLNGLVDGCIIFQGQVLSLESLQNLQRSNLAVVLMNTDKELPGFFQTLSGTEQRLRDSVLWAHELGARRVAIMGLIEGWPHFGGAMRRAVESLRGEVEVGIGEVRHFDPNQVTALDEALDALVAQGPEAIVFNTEFHVLHFLKRQALGTLPKGIGLFYFDDARLNSPLSLHGVRFMEADLWGMGRSAYALVKEAKLGQPPRSEALVWTRRLTA